MFRSFRVSARPAPVAPTRDLRWAHPRKTVAIAILVLWSVALTPLVAIAASNPSQKVVQFSSSVSSSQLLGAIADESVDVIELTAGTYTPGTVKINVDRSRPLVIRPAAGATVVFANGTDAAFLFGYGGRAGNITIQGLIFDGYHIGSIGIIWIGNAHDIAVNDMTVRNSSATSDPTMSWALYVSYDNNVGGTNITANNWTVTGTGSRQISALHFSYAPLHQHVHASGWNVSNVGFAIYADANASDFVLDNWTIANSGAHTSSVYFGNGPTNGVYSNIHTVGSYPLLDASGGRMVNGGGNTWR